MKGLHLKIAKILESEDFNLWQKLNSFMNHFHSQFSSYAASKKAYFKYPLKLQRQNDLTSLNTIFFV